MAENTETETVEETEVEVGPEVAKAIAKELAPQISEMVDSAVEKRIEASEKTVRKDATTPGATDKGVSTVASVSTKSQLESMGKEKFVVRQIMALRQKDTATLAKLNAEALDTLNEEQKAAFNPENLLDTRGKAGYANEGTGADGAFLVPPADFLADVIRLEEQFGVARANARLYETNSNAVTLNKKTGSVAMYELGEGVAKTGTKMSFGQTTISLRKFAAIAALTDELVQDSPVNVYNELTIDFAREHARTQDQLAFTDSTTGILHTSGVNTITVGSSIASLTFDHINQAIYNVPTPAAKNGKFYFERSLLGVLQRIKDSQNRYIWLPGPNGVEDGTIWGYPYALTEVLPGLVSTSDHGGDGNNKGFIVFGDMSYAYLIMKRGLQLTTLLEGTIHGSDGSAINLAEQDMTALRAVSRMNFKVHMPTAFSVIGTGTVS